MRKKGKYYWTIERVRDSAKNFPTRNAFKKGESGAYQAAIRNGWIDQVCGHMTSTQLPFGYWDFDKVESEAKLYTTRNDFRKYSMTAYRVACENKWLDQVCSHMEIQGNIKYRYIYEIADHDRKIVYVGLTYSPKKRKESHERDPKSSRIVEAFGHDLPLKVISERVSLEEASRLEELYIRHYRVMGYQVLNRAKGGGVGGNYIKWTNDEIAKEALKYENKVAFKEGSRWAYSAALDRGIFDEVCSHMRPLRMPDGYWTTENITNEALKYKTRSEFASKCKKAYFQACKLKILDDVCSHMPKRAPKSK